jgi:hypothetical protein
VRDIEGEVTAECVREAGGDRENGEVAVCVGKTSRVDVTLLELSRERDCDGVTNTVKVFLREAVNVSVGRRVAVME